MIRIVLTRVLSACSVLSFISCFLILASEAVSSFLCTWKYALKIMGTALCTMATLEMGINKNYIDSIVDIIY